MWVVLLSCLWPMHLCRCWDNWGQSLCPGNVLSNIKHLKKVVVIVTLPESEREGVYWDFNFFKNIHNKKYYDRCSYKRDSPVCICHSKCLHLIFALLLLCPAREMLQMNSASSSGCLCWPQTWAGISQSSRNQLQNANTKCSQELISKELYWNVNYWI